MVNYVSWLLLQLHLFFLLPAQFAAELDSSHPTRYRLFNSGRLRYLLRMMPAIIFGAGLGHLAWGYTIDLLGVDFQWKISWIGFGIGLVAGTLSGTGTTTKWALCVAMFFPIAYGSMAGTFAGVPIGQGLFWTQVVFTGCSLGSATFIGSRLSIGSSAGIRLGVFLAICVSITTGLVLECMPQVENLTSIELATIANGINGGFVFSVGAGVFTRVHLRASTAILWTFPAILSVGGLYGFAVGFWVDPMTALLSGVATAIAYAVGWWVSYFRLLGYPVDSALAFQSYSRAHDHPERVFDEWRRFPVAWNEVIWLPLPFLSKFLTLSVQQDRERGKQLLTFVARERPLQARALEGPLVELFVQDVEVNSLKDLADAKKKLRRVSEDSVHLPREVLSTVPLLERCAESVQQFYALSGSFNKRKALDEGLETMESLEQSLAGAGTHAPRLLRITERWGTILRAKKDEFAATAAADGEIVNPFVTGKAIIEQDAGNIFVGRHDVVKEIERRIMRNRASTLLLIGPRRMGKTSILRQLPFMLGPDFATVFLDCQKPALRTDIAAFLGTMASGIFRALQERRITVPEFSMSAEVQREYVAFDAWLDQIEAAIPSELRMLICLDEYEALNDAVADGWGEKLLDYFRNISQHRTWIALMLSGARRLHELGPTWPSHFIDARQIPVTYLGESDVRTLLTEPVPEFTLEYANGTVEAIYQATNGQPTLVQVVASELVDFVNDGKRFEATMEDVEDAITQTLESCHDIFFATIWDGCSQSARELLINSALRQSSAKDDTEARSWLVDQKIIDEAGDFCVPMLKRWIYEEKCGSTDGVS